jgi:hypothetical protein
MTGPAAQRALQGSRHLQCRHTSNSNNGVSSPRNSSSSQLLATTPARMVRCLAATVRVIRYNIQIIGHMLLRCSNNRHSIHRALNHQILTPSNRTATFLLHLHLSRTGSQPRYRSKMSTMLNMCRIHRALRTGSSHSKETQASLRTHSREATLFTIMLHLHHLLFHQLARTSLHHRVDGRGPCTVQIRSGSQHLQYINGLAAPS